jgi:hypothetical protein
MTCVCTGRATDIGRTSAGNGALCVILGAGGGCHCDRMDILAAVVSAVITAESSSPAHAAVLVQHLAKQVGITLHEYHRAKGAPAHERMN